MMNKDLYNLRVKTPIAVVDDHHLFRQGLIHLLEDYSEFTVTMQANNGKEFMDHLKELSGNNQPLPEIVLLDIEMPVMDGIDTTVKLKKKYPKMKIIMLTMHDEQEMIVHLIERGANGFLPKNENVEEVADAIRSVQEIGYYFNDRVSRAMVKSLVNSEKIKPKFYSASFSDMELEIISLICKEFTNREIAEKTGLNQRTIDWHRGNILKKTGARNTAGIVMFAVKNNIVI